MSNFQPTLVVDEPIDTGWCRIEVYGEHPEQQAAGRMLIPHARMVLGRLKTQQGFNLRAVEEREVTGGGGFGHQWATLQDGSKIHAITNDGHDTVRIYPPPRVTVKEEGKLEDEDGKGNYLWVGVKVRYDMSQVRTYACEAGLYEPEPKDATELRGIITDGNATGFVYDCTPFNIDASVTPITRIPYADATATDTSFSAAMADWMANWNDPTVGALWSGPFGGGAFALGQMNPGEHNFALRVDPQAGVIGYSMNGILYSSVNTNGFPIVDAENHDAILAGIDNWKPYDPLLSPDKNYSDHGQPYFTNPDQTLPRWPMWDHVFQIDETLTKTPARPYDPRPQIKETYLGLKEAFGQSGYRIKVLPGDYYLGVWFNDDVQAQSTRAGQPIAELSDLGDPVMWSRSGHCDYSEYMKVNGHVPLIVDVEVRMGKQEVVDRNTGKPLTKSAGNYKHFTFEGLVAEYPCSGKYAMLTPFGYGQGQRADDCSKELGANPGTGNHTPFIRINPKLGKAELAAAPPARIYAGRAMWPAAPEDPDVRTPAKAFVFGGVFPQCDQSSWDAGIGHAVFRMWEALSSGNYGCWVVSELTSSSAAALMQGTVPTHVYMIDTDTLTLTDLGAPLSQPSDWAAYSPPLDKDNFFWMYEHAVGYENECTPTGGCLLISTGQSFFEFPNFYGLGIPNFSDPSCC